MLNAGFQYLEQRDANDTITKDGVVGKNSPFATSDNSGIYDIIAEDLRWLKENVDDVKDLSELEAIKQSVTDMYNEMKNDSSFGEATAKAQAEEAKKQAQAALESATNAKTYRDDVVSKSTEANETLAEIKSYIDKAQKLVDSNKELEQSFSDYLTMASNKAKIASDSATNAKASETNAAESAARAEAAVENLGTYETNAAESAAKAEAAIEKLGTHEANAAASASAAKTSEDNAKTSATNAKAAESSVKQYSINASNGADLSKAWADSSESPDSVADADSTTGKTQSSKSWALYAKDRAISAYNSEKNAKASETNAKTSETNAKTSEINAKTSETNAKKYESDAKDHMDASATSETRAKASETNASASAEHAAISETNAKASEINARSSEVSATNSAELAKAWAESIESPDTMNDTDSTTGKTQSSKTWALYSKARAISAYNSEKNAKASETASKTSESNAKASEVAAKASETAAKTSETNASASAEHATASATAAKASETSASASSSSAATSESNAKSYMDTTKGYMDKTQEAYESAQAIQSIVDTAKANAEKCVADVEAVKESLSKIMVYQGSVDNYSDLPTNPQVGYSYNIKNADKTHGVNAGDNVVWNGTEWDNLGGSVDMSLFAEVGKDVNFNTVTATTFTGNLKGNADTATSATKATQDANGLTISENYFRQHTEHIPIGTSYDDITAQGVYPCIDTGDDGKNKVGSLNQYTTSIVIGTGWKHQLIFDTSGKICHRKAINDNIFRTVGDLAYTDSNVASATKATQDADGNAIADTYLKKSGGTMTGNIVLSEPNTGIGLGSDTGIEFSENAILIVTGEEGVHFITKGGTSSSIDSNGAYHGDVVGTATKATQDDEGNTITSTYATKTELSGKQDKLTFDKTPTANSTNPVTSDGVKKYVDSALAALISADDKSY